MLLTAPDCWFYANIIYPKTDAAQENFQHFPDAPIGS